MSHPKLIFHSMDAVFRVIAIDPDMPDPDKHPDRHYRRTIMRPTRGCGTFGGFDSISASTTYEYEDYRKERLVDPSSGREIAYWRRVS